MNRRISVELLKLHQSRTPFNSFLPTLHSISAPLITDLLTDIKRPFPRVCIHSRLPHSLLDPLVEHNRKFSSPLSVTLVSNYRNHQLQSLLAQKRIQQVRYVQGQAWIPQENTFDLLISQFESHKYNKQQALYEDYLRSLKPDGALLGCALTEGTLQQLYWSYLMAQNERHGGMSPKVLQMPGPGQTGSLLTSAKFKLITLLTYQEKLQYQSFVDLVTTLQELGESGYLRGRRKGVFKDLIMAVAGLYHSQFQEKDQIIATISLCYFIAWKFHENQPKQLKPGPVVGSVQFSDELSKFGQVENYLVEQGNDDPKKIK